MSSLRVNQQLRVFGFVSVKTQLFLVFFNISYYRTTCFDPFYFWVIIRSLLSCGSFSTFCNATYSRRLLYVALQKAEKLPQERRGLMMTQ